MKNLELLQLLTTSPASPFNNIKHFAQTPNEIFFISDSLYKYSFSTNSSEEICPHLFENVLHIQLLPIEQKICVTTPEILYIIDPEGLREVLELSFDEKITAISWNPTSELVVTVSESGTVQTFLVDYENGEFFAQGQSSFSAKIPDTVYVGWGSKDTQFRGSEGKLKPNQQESDAGLVVETVPTISWRGNGEMFVVNFWRANKREFIVLETPCRALYRSEPCPGLQPPIAWRPTGNMIAALTEKNVVIFEKNGQKRFEIPLEAADACKVKKLKWSPCAQILALFSEDETSQTIHLLTSSNYKWYEKQTLKFSSRENPFLDFDWLETNDATFNLQVITARQVVKYCYALKITRIEQICAVISGKTAQITDFSEEIIPPILSSGEIATEEFLNFVALNKTGEIAVVDCRNHISVFDANKNRVKVINLSEKLPGNFPLALHHFVFEEDSLYFAYETETATNFVILDVKTESLKSAALNSNLRHFVVGNFQEYQHENLSHVQGDLFVNNSLNSVQNSVKVIENKCIDCSLLANGSFLVDNVKIRDDVNSFEISRDDYLLFTTKSNQLFCIRLDTQNSIETLLLNNANLENIYKRSVEQGASIVACIPNSPRIVLQMPRGNLETISCRLISIDILDRLLEQKQWKQAVRFIRIEKLNANLLFDLNPSRFLDQIEDFIAAFDTVNELNAICVEFEEANVLKTLYKNWKLMPEEYASKIQTVFIAILGYFDSVDYSTYISTIMIITVNFFELREALVYIQDLLKRSREDVCLKKSVLGAVQTLKNYGCDQERLYVEALLLYDLELAAFVAGCCQMDPRVFEPQLATLRSETSEARRRFSINVFAKKPQIAIGYLLRSENAEEKDVFEFLRNFKVAREAYATCKKSSRFFAVVSKVFAEELSKRGEHAEAGVVLKRANLLNEALEEFKLALEWRQVMNLVEELRLERVEKLQTVDKLGNELVSKGFARDAAILYEFYGNNYEMAARILVENCMFEEAVHLAKKHGRNDIILSDIIPAVFKHKSYLIEKLTELEALFSKHKARLCSVRQARSDRFNNFAFDGDDRGGDGDLFSDAGSIVSTRSSRSSRSRSSTASSKNRRKEARKKQDLREGGVYEDIALIRAIHSLIGEVYRKRDEVTSCCLVLMQESDAAYNEIREVYDLFKRVDEVIKRSTSEIWPAHFYGNRDNLEREQLADLENLEHLDLEYRTAPSRNGDFNLSLFS